ncbi:MAG TPA: hypothetical protein VJS43_06540, partial [Candidatus Acidoferrales bacterium]|nr:hypothetical protein [Candidatus Acidoferrales bacterium]
QVMLGDVISIDWDGSADVLQFIKDAEGALVAAAPAGERLAEAAAANSEPRTVHHLRTIAAADRWPPARPR